MSSNNTLCASVEQNEIIPREVEFENMVQSDESATDLNMEVVLESLPEPVPRGRGRPRVTRRHDESAIEKRRAQVREAQRAYQKRKDKAIATDKRRVDQLLQVLSDLSSDVESLLDTASKVGHMSRNDNVSTHIQRLWASYNRTINDDCVKPELRLLQIKNEERIASYHSSDNFRVVPTIPQPTTIEPNIASSTASTETSLPFDPTQATFNYRKFGETSVLQPYQRLKSFNTAMDGRSVFDIVKERQAALKEADRAANP